MRCKKLDFDSLDFILGIHGSSKNYSQVNQDRQETKDILPAKNGDDDNDRSDNNSSSEKVFNAHFNNNRIIISGTRTSSSAQSTPNYIILWRGIPALPTQRKQGRE